MTSTLIKRTGVAIFMFVIASASIARTGAGEFPTEAQAIKDLKAKYPDRPWDEITFKPQREWVLEHEKVAKILPPDTAKRMMLWTEKKKEDGSWMAYEGFAIYQRDVSGPGPWVFNRCFVMGGKLQGKKGLSNEELLKSVMDEIKATADTRNARLWWGPTQNLYHVYSVTIPENSNFEYMNAENYSFDLVVVLDTKQSNTKISKVKQLMRVERKTHEEKAWLRPRVKKSEVLGTTEVAKTKDLPSLATLGWDKIYGPDTPDYKNLQPVEGGSSRKGGQTRTSRSTPEPAKAETAKEEPAEEKVEEEEPKKKVDSLKNKFKKKFGF